MHRLPIWKITPFLRILLPLVAGIIIQWYFQVSLDFIILALASFTIAFSLFYFLPLSLRFKISFLQGNLLNCMVLVIGLLITWNKDVRHTADWYGNYYTDSSYVIVRIDEPLIEKTKSFKADGFVEAVINNEN